MVLEIAYERHGREGGIYFVDPTAGARFLAGAASPDGFHRRRI
jgi:hypothetical protein